MSSEIVYDLCIVGAGMFGSAAARHASANSALKVCLIGPSEPTDEERMNRDIFSSHYDEGRITRILDVEPACQTLSKHSINRHKDLETLSGINFYTPVGCLFTGRRDGKFMSKLIEASRSCNSPLVELNCKDVFQKRYPYLKLKEDEYAVLDDNGAGHISPRKLVSAQKEVANLQGCHIVDDIVCRISTLTSEVHEVHTEKNGAVKAKRIVIATGAYVNLKNLDTIRPVKLKRCKETVVLLEVPEEEAKRLSFMPAIIRRRESDIPASNSIGAYILPPIKYPDGRYYLKFGKSGDSNTDLINSLEEMKQWFLSEGDNEIINTHLEFVTDLFPGLNFSNVTRKTCVTCYSPSGLPYIDRVLPTVTVAVAGNGKGAKLSDEVGRIVAHLSITGEWDSELTQGQFKIIFK